MESKFRFLKKNETQKFLGEKRNEHDIRSNYLLSEHWCGTIHDDNDDYNDDDDYDDDDNGDDGDVVKDDDNDNDEDGDDDDEQEDDDY